MRNISALTIFTVLVVGFLPSRAGSQAVFDSGDLRISVDRHGQLSSLYDLLHEKEYLAKDVAAPLLTIKVQGNWEQPSSAVLDRAAGIVKLRFQESKTNVHVKIVEKRWHFVFEVTAVDPPANLDALVWGPFPTTINASVGEIVGVVRDDHYAVGLLGLNVKTLGGYPVNDEGLDFTRGRAAEQKPWGSVLQAYSLDRSKPRTITVWNGNFPRMSVPPIPGETVVGSKVALFGCVRDRALETIGIIEVGEDLPHPMVDEVWMKKWSDLGRSYLIANFSEADIDEMLQHMQRSNLMTLYHMEPFESWGHYEIGRKYFPNGVEGLKKCVEKANAMGFRLGAHTLTNFIQTNDPYITPVPDPRLAKTGSSVLMEDLSAEATEVPVASPEYFANENANWLHTVMIEQELIRYRAVSATSPWKLLDCERGAFGTRRSAHTKGSEVGKLLDHPYKVFFPNFEMQREIARNLAKRFNQTGLSQMDFDGHEGCAASGQGDYALEVFAKDFYDNLDHFVVNGTSTSEHFYWHINTYCNWGEPWYEGFRESMQEYRINNQVLFERNFLPNMLGWYLLTETTSLSDIEWMLARAAGFNAGFALATSLEALRKNPDTILLLDAIREWETARRLGAFTDKQRESLRNPKKEFHLERVESGVWNLFPFHESQDYIHEQMGRESVGRETRRWEYVNPDEEQPLQFKLRVVGDSGHVVNPSFQIDNAQPLVFPLELRVGQTLVCEKNITARVYDEKGRQIKTVRATSSIPQIASGAHRVRFGCTYSADPTPRVIVNFKTMGASEMIMKK